MNRRFKIINYLCMLFKFSDIVKKSFYQPWPINNRHLEVYSVYHILCCTIHVSVSLILYLCIFQKSIHTPNVFLL